MKRVVVLLVFAAAALLAAAVPGLAQEPKPEFLLIYQEHVKPSMVQQYEASGREFVAALAAAKADSPAFDIYAMQTMDFTYLYMTPFDSMAALDAFHKDWMELSDKIGKEKMKAIMEKGAPAVESADQYIAMKEPALSFTPAEPRLKPGEGTYYVNDFLYVIPGKEDEFKAVAKQIAEFFKKKGLHNGYMIYSLLFGDQMPLFVVVQPGKDAVDWAAQDAQDWAALGPEGQGLIHKAIALCRKFERQMGNTRPDLAYHPQGKKLG
jgi:hypothetical protein